MKSEIVIVGAGISGTAIAYNLRRSLTLFSSPAA